MRVGVLIKNTTLHSSYGGLETQNKVLCEGLVKRGYDVVVFAPKRDLDINEKNENGVKYVFVESIFQRFSSIFSVSPKSWLVRSFEEVLIEHNIMPFDLLISQSSAGLGVIKEKQQLGIPIISISHGSKIGEAQTRLTELTTIKSYLRFLVDVPHILRAFFITQREFVHGSDLVVTVSNAVKQSLVEETYLVEDKIKVVHNGVDPNLFVNKNKQMNTKVKILYVGRVIRSKGLFLLVSSVAKLLQLESSLSNKFEIVVVGSGEDLEALKKLVATKDLNDIFTFVGKVNYKDVIKYFSSCDVFVLPSLRVEGFPMVLVEALFSKLAIIAADIGGNSDAIINDDTGLLINSNDEDALVHAMRSLINDKDLREKLSKSGYDYAIKNFTVESMLNKYEKVFKEVLK